MTHNPRAVVVARQLLEIAREAAGPESDELAENPEDLIPAATRILVALAKHDAAQDAMTAPYRNDVLEVRVEVLVPRELAHPDGTRRFGAAAAVQAEDVSEAFLADIPESIRATAHALAWAARGRRPR